MATIAAILGGSIISGIGSGIVDSYRENQRQREWNKNYEFDQAKFDWLKDYQQQNLAITSRGQNLNFMQGLGQAGIGAASGLASSFLNYQSQSNQLDYQKQLNSQRRADLEKDGLPMSYLHLNGGLASAPRVFTQGFGRSVNPTNSFMNQGGQPYNQTFGSPAPPPYSASPVPERTSAHLAASGPRQPNSRSMAEMGEWSAKLQRAENGESLF